LDRLVSNLSVGVLLWFRTNVLKVKVEAEQAYYQCVLLMLPCHAMSCRVRFIALAGERFLATVLSDAMQYVICVEVE
jgi:hypothetical protein